MESKSYHLLFVAVFFVVLIWSAINPHDYTTLFLEIFPALIGLTVLIFTYSKFQFTTFVYFLILCHAIILCAGGKYTYALNPLFEWVKDFLHSERNNYDKLGHFAQGFIPAVIVRELFIRLNVFNKKKWIFFCSVSVIVFISACYEFIEWWTALLIGGEADSFLGTQGYVWDTQSDMFFALIGSLTALIFFSRFHDRMIDKISSNP